MCRNWTESVGNTKIVVYYKSISEEEGDGDVEYRLEELKVVCCVEGNKV